MNKELWQKAIEIAAKNYSVVTFEEKDSNGQPIFLARIQEFYGCMAQGNSKEEALENLREASIDYIYSLLIDNLEIPQPTRIIFSSFETKNIPEDENVFIVNKTISFEQKANKTKKSQYFVEAKVSSS
jgi:predicted RNase H-like HicB family nuclease